MVEYFHLYIKQECPFCVQAVELLKEKNKTHVITTLDNAPEILEEYKKQYNHTTVPIVVKYDNFAAKGALIGGYTDLEKYLGEALDD